MTPDLVKLVFSDRQEGVNDLPPVGSGQIFGALYFTCPRELLYQVASSEDLKEAVAENINDRVRQLLDSASEEYNNEPSAD